LQRRRGISDQGSMRGDRLNGFFQQSELQRRTPLPLLPRCGACKLNVDGCVTSKMCVSGEGRKQILIVGEIASVRDDQQGRQFTGKRLNETLRKFGLEMRRDCWLTNAVICRSRKAGPKHVDHCRPNLVNAIKELKPEKIILLGKLAVRSLIGWLWKEDVGAFDRWIGWRIPNQRLNAWICPTFHPSYVDRLLDDRKGRPKPSVAPLMFERHLEDALRVEGRPWKTVPDFKRMIRVEMNPDVAARAIRRMQESSDGVSFDYETDRLKPDHDDARIVCCSVANEELSVAYPWTGAAIDATKELLTSGVPKDGWNVQMEDRWTRKKLGVKVRNWRWDGMIGAHIEDCRRGISGLKFQAFVHLGLESYDDAIKPFLKANGGNERNNVHKVKTEQLLEYCAMDSLTEHMLCKGQRERMKT
jgi:uracil-DNA glycosylase family 4